MIPAVDHSIIAQPVQPAEFDDVIGGDKNGGIFDVLLERFPVRSGPSESSRNVFPDLSGLSFRARGLATFQFFMRVAFKSSLILPDFMVASPASFGGWSGGGRSPFLVQVTTRSRRHLTKTDLAFKVSK